MASNGTVDEHLMQFSSSQMVIVLFFSGIISLITVTGNVLVIVAFKVNRNLKSANNYFLLSLAVADIVIGLVSMNLFTTYVTMGRWVLGPVCCDMWLVTDYVASNASVMHLLVISFDRYLSITRPLKYKAKRTTKRVVLMIATAWAVSIILWAPAILFWQYIIGIRTVAADRCYIQFLSEPIITFGTAILAFYLPAAIIMILYWRIYLETQKRFKELKTLQGAELMVTKVPPLAAHVPEGCPQHPSEVQPPCNGDAESQPRTLVLCCEPPVCKEKDVQLMEAEQEEDIEEDGVEKQLPELKVLYPAVFPLCGYETSFRYPRVDEISPRDEREAEGEDPAGRCGTPRRGPKNDLNEDNEAIGDRQTDRRQGPPTREDTGRSTAVNARRQMTKRKHNNLVNEKKAAKTLSAILLAFIVTWTPYNIMVLVSTFCNRCIPSYLWNLGYWLCYVNSTVNPMCYALCNKTFRETFKLLLLCRQSRIQKSY
uniref:muscarinic acetylcholine receptor M1-like n=1 Tax=Myxine glutinosa TaxID=7769 RepID=UPI00358E024D